MLNIFFYILVLCQCVESDVYGVLPEVEVSENDVEPALIDGITPMTGVYHRVTKKYECRTDRLDQIESFSILYGTEAWTFPEQDVNLVLRYPGAGNSSNYYITRVTVILYIDGWQSKGYVKKGGLLDNHIEINFDVNNTTRLAYQFWLYGVHKSNFDAHLYKPYYDYNKLC